MSSEANCPLAEVSAYSAAVYAGGFTGSNAGGSIQSCYALGVLKARDVSASTVRLCGFAGERRRRAGLLLQRHGADRRR